MLFNSFEFVAFFAVVLLVYPRLQHRAQNVFLLLASYYFYACWDWRFTGLLATSTVVDYCVAHALAAEERAGRRRALLLVSLITNLGILGFFKYFDFFIASAVELLSGMGVSTNPFLLRVLLPVGISFYTFQTLAYTIDVYRRSQEPTRDFIAFGVYVAYFPQLVAGPIERASRLLPQILSPRAVTTQQWASGAQLILWGYVKKVAVADSLAPYVDAAFANPENVSGGTLLLAVYCFALQIYCDFSGYSDIARGVSRLLGIELMENFKQPYLSRNITEFWRRWHVSLSTWLRDYLYIPLGGNRQGAGKQYRNLMLTMLLGGLWHGAGWTFVVWGGLHGIYLAAHKYMTQNRKVGLGEAPRDAGAWGRYILGVVGTFHLVCLAWVFFRAESIDVAYQMLSTMLASVLGAGFGAGDTALLGVWEALTFYGVLVLLLDAACWKRGAESPFVDSHPVWLRGVAYACGLFVLAFVRERGGEEFIYFQF
jgi:D-alanyl-lipoteichoic acid acyltransferase DltB (MBOAT superfamily)